jgi:hypothetical protein
MLLLLYALSAQAQTASSWHSGLQAFTTNRAVLEELYELDRIAHHLQRQAFDRTAREVAGQQRATFTPSAVLQEALAAYQAAEIQLEIAFGDAWQAMETRPVFPAWTTEAMAIAGRRLHATVRRGAGPRLHTTVPGLQVDRGCAGDILEDRLVSAYFDAVAAAPVSVGHTNDAFLILDNVARQVACLGAAQLAALENALYAGALFVEGDMKAHGLASLTPTFVRLLAPLQVIVLDARKHRGVHAKSWQWFDRHGAVLADAVARAGWVTGDLYVWDRLHGGLQGIPSCTNGGTGSRCVDLRQFLDSLRDPRALGYGDCAFAWMIADGVQSIAGRNLYLCPATVCPGTTSKEAGGYAAQINGQALGQELATPARQQAMSPEGLAFLQGIWPQLTTQDLNAMESPCLQAGQVAGSALREDCATSLFDKPAASPFDRYERCRSEALETDRDPFAGGTALHGVPQGNKCRLAQGGPPPASPPPPPPPPPPPSPPPKETEESEDVASKAWKLVNKVGSAAKSLAKKATGATGSPVSTAAGRLTSVLKQLADPNHAPDFIKGIASYLVRDELNGMLLEGAISNEEYTEQVGRLGESGGIGSVSQWIKDKKGGKTDGGGGAQDCFDPLACSNTCTGLSQQVNALNTCTMDFIDEALTAAGHGSWEPGEQKPIDIYSYPNPHEDSGGKDEGAGACFSTSPTRQPTHCGLIMCEGGMAQEAGGSCGCGGARLTLPPSLCTDVRCPEGFEPGPDCQCHPLGPQPEIAPPVPDITSVLILTSQVREKAWGFKNPHVLLFYSEAAIFATEGNRGRAFKTTSAAVQQYAATLGVAHPAVSLVRQNQQVFLELKQGAE